MRSSTAQGYRLFLLTLGGVFLHAGCAATRGVDANAGGARAGAGDTVWIVENRVKADRRDEFEQFIEAFWGVAFGEKGRAALTPSELRAFRTTRVLRPSQANPDGTYSFFFVMDPAVGGVDYEIESLLERLYTRAEADRVMRLFSESLAGEQVVHETTQLRY